MNVVTDGRAIRRRIVCAVYRDIGSPARSRIKDKWNEVGFRIVILADLGRGIGPSGVEVTQSSRFYSMGTTKIIHHVLANELAKAIGIDRIWYHVLGDWYALRLAVDRAT